MTPDQDMDRDVVDQADALMRRYRSFVARPADSAPQPQAADNVETYEDLPLLTEVVDASGSVPADIPTVLDAVRKDIDQALSDWLIEALPAAVANASQQILSELDTKARNTLLPRLREVVEAYRNEDSRGQSL